MDPLIAVAVFPVIFLGELPDKTMFASLVLSTRGRAAAVWLGAAGAFAVHVVIATTVGVLAFRLLPQRAVEVAVAVMFLGGALLAARGAWREPPPDETGPGRPARAARPLRLAATAFGVIFAAEWGDLTQILTVNLAAHYHSPLSVAVGALAALWAVAAIAVIGGQRLARLVHPRLIGAGTALLLAGLAAYAGWTAVS